MKEFDDLQVLWRSHRSSPPHRSEGMMERIERRSRHFRAGAAWNGAAFVLGFIGLLWLWSLAEFQTWTSHVALLVALMCTVYGLGMQVWKFRSMGRISAGSLERPAAYVAFLKEFEEEHHDRHTRSFRMYGLAVALALVLFAPELYFMLPVGWFLFFSVLVIAWFLWAYFVFSRAYLANERQKIQQLRADLERIQRQLG